MKIKAKFVNDNGGETIAVFDQGAGMAIAEDGRQGAYSRSAPNEITFNEPHVVMTFDKDIQFEVGFSGRYSTTDGRQGMATILAIDP